MTKSEKFRVSIIAAIDEQQGIGKKGKLPWHIPQDLKRFKKITMGHPIIMGRKTFESIGKPLTGRDNIILTKDKDFKVKGCKVCHSLEEAIRVGKDKGDQEIFIIGGGEIYKQTLHLADKLYLTLVHGQYDADSFFPDYSEFKKIVHQEKWETDNYSFTFLELIR